VESVDIPALLEPTARLLRSLGYQGMAEVEYKLDAAGEYKLIEINPRHWDWHRLGNASGVNLTWTAYCHLTGRPVERWRLPTAPAKWIAEDTLAHYCLQRAMSGQINPRKLINSLSGQRIYGIFAWSDPLPFIRYSLSVGLPRLGKKIVTELGHKAGLFSLLAASVLITPGVRNFYS
jgi:predicted ATP-grasp superfamily ATP-dependent carboligase